MPAIEPLCYLVGINPIHFSKKEVSLLEAELFVSIYHELKEYFRQQYKVFFQLMKFNLIMEDTMLENNFIQIILNDILSTEEYTLAGIARYVDTHEDVIQELASGLNTKPLAICLRRTIELHKIVRRDLYQSIGKKIASIYLPIENSSEGATQT